MPESYVLWSVAAGGGTVVGAAMLFIRKNWGKRTLSFFLGLAAGVMAAVVGFDLLPSMAVTGGGIGLLGLFWGMVLLGMFDSLVLTGENTSSSLVGLGYLIMIGVALHDFPEGLAIAMGMEMKSRTGMVVALGVGIHNIPEGMAIAAPLLTAGVSRFKVLLEVILVGIITPLGALIGHFVVKHFPWYLPFFLGLASGVMIYLVLFQLWPEARRSHSFYSRFGLYSGIVLIFAATYVTYI